MAKQQPKQFISRGTLTSIDLHETSLDPQIAPENAYTLSGPGISQTREPVRTGNEGFTVAVSNRDSIRRDPGGGFLL